MYSSDRSSAASPSRFLGACAGVADRAGVDPLLLRIGAVGLALLVSFKLTIVVYCIAAVALRLQRR